MLNIVVFRWDEVIIYLRKSRADNPSESVEEVLERHERMLQEKAVEMFGKEIPESNIYREVVSGETLSEREEALKVLSRIEDPRIKAVMVVDPQRLSRGDLEDCGRVVNAFKYTNTQIITLQMTYDLNNKMHRKFFEQELMRGNDYLEYVKDVLQRGRLHSVQHKGCFIAPNAPFGYDKVIIDGNPTLKPNESADVVRLIYDLYNEHHYSYGKIVKYLNEMGIKPLRVTRWEEATVRVILTNPHYTGVVRYGYKKKEKKFEDGVLVSKKVRAADEEVIIAKGLHEAIIPAEVFEKAQERIRNNPRAKWDAPLQNPFAGLIICKTCGKTMLRYSPTKTLHRIRCGTKQCGASVSMEALTDAILFALQNESLPDLESKASNNEGLSANIQKKQLEKLKKELEELQEQEENQFELLEKRVYTEEMFLKRHKVLTVKIEGVQSQIYKLKQAAPKEVNYSSKVVKLKDAIAGIKDDSISAESKNKLLKSIIERIEFEFLGKQGRKNLFKLHIFLRV